MSTGKWLSLLFLTLWVTACGTTPDTRYYYLASNDQAQLQALALSGAIGVGPVEVAGHIDRPQLTTTNGSSQLTLASYDQWAEPLDKAIARVLLKEIEAQVETPVYRFPWRSDMQPRYSIRVQVDQLDRVDGRAILEANWLIVDLSGKHQPQQQTVALSVELSDQTYTALVDQYSLLVSQLGEAIVQSVP